MRPKTAADWRAWLASLPQGTRLEGPASDAAIQAVEREFGIELHNDLRTLLSVSNGVLSPAGYWLVWPVAMMLERNRFYRTAEEYRSSCMPMDHLLFIGEAPNGDLFAYPISADGNAGHRNDIFKWGHETDTRSEAAVSLRSYMQGVAEGSIEV